MDTSVNSKVFFEKYKSVLSEEQFNRLEDFTLGIKKSLQYSDEEIAELDSRLKVHNDFTQKLYRTANRNNEGIALEKKGHIESAIKVYEENIKDGYPATHSFERLMIIYRKLKRYTDEVRVIEAGISIIHEKNPKASLDWSKRLIKVKKFLSA